MFALSFSAAVSGRSPYNNLFGLTPLLRQAISWKLCYVPHSSFGAVLSDRQLCSRQAQANSAMAAGADLGMEQQPHRVVAFPVARRPAVERSQAPIANFTWRQAAAGTGKAQCSVFASDRPRCRSLHLAASPRRCRWTAARAGGFWPAQQARWRFPERPRPLFRQAAEYRAFFMARSAKAGSLALVSQPVARMNGCRRCRSLSGRPIGRRSFTRRW